MRRPGRGIEALSRRADSHASQREQACRNHVVNGISGCHPSWTTRKPISRPMRRAASA